MTKHTAGKKLAWRVGGGLLLVLGLAAFALVALSVFDRARSGSDAALFNVTVPPTQRAEWLGESAAPDTQGASSPDARFASAYPGDRINPKFWDDPLWAGAAPYGSAAMPEGFEPVTARDMALSPVVTGQAKRMRVPAISLDSPVASLEIVDLGDQRQYETPVNTVGFIPQTALPGEASSGWYFGHFESAIRGEGSVFRRVPEIASLIREDPVDVFLATDNAEYLYRVTSTQQLHESDLVIAPAPDARITLVTCWPSRVYDQRILVHAELIGIRRLSG
jgi:sortase (surface protein transpeptidase)